MCRTVQCLRYPGPETLFLQPPLQPPQEVAATRPGAPRSDPAAPYPKLSIVAVGSRSGRGRVVKSPSEASRKRRSGSLARSVADARTTLAARLGIQGASSARIAPGRTEGSVPRAGGGVFRIFSLVVANIIMINGTNISSVIVIIVMYFQCQHDYYRYIFRH